MTPALLTLSSSQDFGTISAVFSLLTLIAGAVVLLATIRRTWAAQTVTELKTLADAQAARIDFLEEQLKLMADQLGTVQGKLTAMELDSLALLRRNRELSDLLETAKEKLRRLG